MYFRKIFFLLLFIVISSACFAQSKAEYSTKKKKAIALFEKSEIFMMRRQFPQAIQLLKEAISKDEDFAEAHLRLGSLLRDVGNIDKAAYHLNKAVQVLPNDRRTAGAYYVLAELNFQDMHYKQAKALLEKFKTVGKPDKRLLPEVEKLMTNINFSIEAIKDSLSLRATPMKAPLNRFQLQYFPVLTADKSAIIYTRRERATEQFDEDIVISKKAENGQWQEPEPISPVINTKNNEGTTAISADGRMLIFTSCVGRKGYGSCDLFVTYKTGEEWSEPENMGPQINSFSWESQPALSADGRTLYFVSDRPSGLGKRDIWVSYYGEEGWSKAENLGEKINTEDDEVSPFIHVNNQALYFASKGHPGFGGFDLFSTENTEVGWTNPRNMGYPLNNSADQVSLFISSDGKEGFYSYEEHYRTPYYSSKLYTFQVPEAIQVENKSNYVKGKVFDADTKRPMSAKIELYDIAEDQLVGAVTSDSINGKYLMVLTEGSEYALYASKPGYLFQSLSFDYSVRKDLVPINIDIFLAPIKQGSKTTLENLFFDTGEYALRPKSKTELTKVINFLKNNPRVEIEIGGHTDDVGSEEYNQTLSLNRAKAVYDYLLKHEVEARQLQYKGYGETQPLLPNDSEVNRQKNRRIGFTIL